jgi:hypothetical protein
MGRAASWGSREAAVGFAGSKRGKRGGHGGAGVGQKGAVRVFCPNRAYFGRKAKGQRRAWGCIGADSA